MAQSSTVKWNGKAISRKARDSVMAGLNVGGEHLLKVSRDLVPIDEATLERSGVVTQDEATLTVAVSYDTPYAEKQHEDLTIRHAPGRQAKYLETPFVGEAAVIERLVGVQVKRRMAA